MESSSLSSLNPGTAGSGPADRRPAADPRRRRLRQDARHRAPHRHLVSERPGRARPRCSPSRSPTRRRRRCGTRVETLLGVDCRQMWISTFHALCARLLRREAPHIGLSRDFVIYDSADQLSVVKQALRELGIDDSALQPRLALSRISHAKNRMEGPESFTANALEPARRSRSASCTTLRAGAEGRQRARLRRPAAEDGRAVREVGSRCASGTARSSGT